MFDNYEPIEKRKKKLFDLLIVKSIKSLNPTSKSTANSLTFFKSEIIKFNCSSVYTSTNFVSSSDAGLTAFEIFKCSSGTLNSSNSN